MIDGENQFEHSTYLIPRELQNTSTSIPLSEEYTVSIDGDYVGYDDLVNRINTMDVQLRTYNNGDINVDWFDVIYISSFQIQHQFISEGKSNSNIFHEEDFDPYIIRMILLFKLFIWKIILCHSKSKMITRIFTSYVYMMILVLKWTMVQNVQVLTFLIS